VPLPMHWIGMETGDIGTDLRRRMGTFLSEWHVMSLATADRDGPYAANLFYASDGFALLWVSAPDARHSRAIAISPRVAATIAPDYSDFAIIKGLQIEGAARQVTNTEERQTNLAILEARYPFLARRGGLPATVRDAYAHAAIYRLEPSRIVLIDNLRGFGHRDVLELSA
jgi:uncharacterized protein YhbP (UPF0306 family)